MERSVRKINYQQELDKIVSNIETEHRMLAIKDKPTLLLHACCAPCSSYVIEYLVKWFSITVLYYNPNIYPEIEYQRRLNEINKFLQVFPPASGIQLISVPYDPEDYYAATGVRDNPVLQAERERGERCRVCYQFRMKKTFEYAKVYNFDWFTTTLSISPYKDADKINEIGKQLSKEGRPRFLTSDFKKRNGFLRSLQLSDEYGLYRQEYCGCIYSKQNKELSHSSSI